MVYTTIILRFEMRYTSLYHPCLIELAMFQCFTWICWRGSPADSPRFADFRKMTCQMGDGSKPIVAIWLGAPVRIHKSRYVGFTTPGARGFTKPAGARTGPISEDCLVFMAATITCSKKRNLPTGPLCLSHNWIQVGDAVYDGIPQLYRQFHLLYSCV